MPIAASAQSKSPSFAQYEVAIRSKIRPTRPHLNTKMARLFRTSIKNQAEKGPDFAGHYTIVLLGCGSSCRRYAIADALTGDVYFPKELDAFGTSAWRDGDQLANEEPLQYKRASRLLIIVGSGKMDKFARKGKYFYEWKNNRLKLLRAIKRDYS